MALLAAGGQAPVVHLGRLDEAARTVEREGRLVPGVHLEGDVADAAITQDDEARVDYSRPVALAAMLGQYADAVELVPCAAPGDGGQADGACRPVGDEQLAGAVPQDRADEGTLVVDAVPEDRRG